MQSAIEILHEQILKGAQASTDSRNISPQTIFFALKGEKFDGNDFALDALKSGALLAVAENPSLPETPGLIKVESVLQTLQQLARHYRTGFSIPVIGITGTNGKTTTKELMGAVLAKKYCTHFTQGNYNNHIGVPLTLLQLQNKHQIAVIEMGANHMGEIDLLSNIADPDYGLITNTGKAHIEGFGSAENIVTAKTELYRYLQKKNGLIFVNGDNPILMNHCSKYNNISTYGQHPEHHVYGQILDASPFLHVEAFVRKHDGEIVSAVIRSQLIGAYNFENIMAAVAIGHYFAIPLQQIKEALEEYMPNNSRSQYTDTGKNKVIWDAYNANPTSMRLALENFEAMQTSSKAVILGDMLELGNTAREEHQNIAVLQHEMGFDICLLVGNEFSSLPSIYPKTMVFRNTAEASQWLEANPIMGYTILVKGSRGIALEKLRPLL